MAFPVNPVNGQTTFVNNVGYVYNSTRGTWTNIVSGPNTLPGSTVLTTLGGTVLGNLAATNFIGSTYGYLNGAIGANIPNTGVFTTLLADSATITGNLVVNGTLSTINANNFTISNSMIYLAEGNPANSVDIGFVGTYNTSKFTGLLFDHASNNYRLFNNLDSQPGFTADFANSTPAGLSVGAVTGTTGTLSGNLTAPGITVGNATTTSTQRVGNLITTGGVFWSNGTSFSSGSGGSSSTYSFTEVPTVYGTTVLTNTSSAIQYITGAGFQHFNLPNTTTCSLGQMFTFINLSPGNSYIKLSTGGMFVTLYAYSQASFLVINNTTNGNSSWQTLSGSSVWGTTGTAIQALSVLNKNPVLEGIQMAGNISTYSGYPNVTIAAPTIVYGNLTSTGIAKLGNVITTNGVFWANGTSFSSGGGGSSYSNTDVATYLPTYTGNITAGNLTVSGNINTSSRIYANGFYWSNGTALSTGSSTANSMTEVVSAGSVTVLTNTSSPIQYMTGGLFQFFNLPDTTTCYLGQTFTIVNFNSNNATVRISNGNSYATVYAFTQMTFMVTNISVNNTASWQILSGPSLWGTTGSANQSLSVLNKNPVLEGIQMAGSITNYSGYPNVSITAPTVVYGNLTSTGNVTAGNLITTNGVFWANGTSFSSGGGGSSYSNTDVATYLPTYTGNITAGNLITTDGVFWANGTSFSSGSGGSGSYPTAITASTLGVTGLTTVAGIVENATVNGTALASATFNYDVLIQALYVYTTAGSNNYSINFRGNSSTTLNSVMSVGQSMSVAFIQFQGATARYPNAFAVDGTTITVKWSGGTAITAGNASGYDIYTFNIIKTAATPTFLVFGTQQKFA